MPVTWNFAVEEELVTAQAKGPTTYEQCISMLEEVSGDPRHDPRFKVLVDVRGIDYSPSVAEVRQLAEALVERRESFSKGMAVIVDPGPHYDLAELCSRLAKSQGFTLACFGTEPLARDWCSRNGD